MLFTTHGLFALSLFGLELLESPCASQCCIHCKISEGFAFTTLQGLSPGTKQHKPLPDTEIFHLCLYSLHFLLLRDGNFK